MGFDMNDEIMKLAKACGAIRVNDETCFLIEELFSFYQQAFNKGLEQSSCNHNKQCIKMKGE